MIWFRRGVIVALVISTIAFTISMRLWWQGYDVEAPVITMEDTEIEVNINDGEEVLLEGISAFDTIDGDVTDLLMVENISGFSSDMSREVSILSFDRSNNVTAVTRTISYSDYAEPRFSLSSALKIAAGDDVTDFLNYLSVEDCIEGDISEWIQQYYVGDSVIDTAVAGYYPMTFSVFNSMGDSVEFQATIEVYDATKEADKPEIELSEYMIYLENGEVFEPEDYVQKVIINEATYIRSSEGVLEDLSYEPVQLDDELEEVEVSYPTFDMNQIAIINEVDTSTSGWYEVSYSLTNVYGDERVVYLVVCVEGN